MLFFFVVELVLCDFILGLNEVFNVDICSIKVNLGVGVYFIDEGKILVLCVV